MEKYWIPEKVNFVKINRQLYRNERGCSKSIGNIHFYTYWVQKG